jgi:lysosomal acid phosphatase
MRHCFEFGNFLKNYYAGYIGGFYEREKVFIRSTDYDRTLMSAQGILAGLFVPEGYQVWNENIKWQPVPVHTSNIELDKVKIAENYIQSNF